MLIDDILQFNAKEPLFGPFLKTMLTSALRFQIDNVAAYAYDTMLNIDKPGEEVYIPNHIPNIAPLAPVMWFEFGGLAKGANKPATNRYGCLISIDYDKKEPGETWYKPNEESQWILRMQCFAKLSDSLACMRLCHYVSVLNDGGFGGSFSIELAKSLLPETRYPPLYNEAVAALLAICFAHCKGTSIEEHQPTRQIRRAAERTGKPTFSFHTIDIHPSTTILKSEGHISENGLVRALHICRGHFAHYTKEHPLFGKYTGTFYRPMHVRGSASQGITFKDYRVHPTEEETR